MCGTCTRERTSVIEHQRTTTDINVFLFFYFSVATKTGRKLLEWSDEEKIDKNGKRTQAEEKQSVELSGSLKR